LLRECDAGGVQHRQPCAVHAIRRRDGYEVDTDRGTVTAPRLVVATGGLSIPKIGATDFGYRVARQLGHSIVDLRPALVPLTFDEALWRPFVPLAGLSLEVTIEAGDAPRGRFVEDLLFTHRGLSGPAVLQASTYWRAGQSLRIALADGATLRDALRVAKTTSRRQLGNELAQHLPQRLAELWLDRLGLDPVTPMPQVRDKDLGRIAESLARWELVPTGSEGWRKAEVTAGGVQTRRVCTSSARSSM
jgi:predicted Rossmann fold flavoprotein